MDYYFFGKEIQQLTTDIQRLKATTKETLEEQREVFKEISLKEMELSWFSQKEMEEREDYLRSGALQDATKVYNSALKHNRDLSEEYIAIIRDAYNNFIRTYAVEIEKAMKEGLSFKHDEKIKLINKITYQNQEVDGMYHMFNLISVRFKGLIPVGLTIEKLKTYGRDS